MSDDEGSIEVVDVEKRHHHNNLERQRRNHIKRSFRKLSKIIPSLRNAPRAKSSSRAVILKEATDFINKSVHLTNQMPAETNRLIFNNGAKFYKKMNILKKRMTQMKEEGNMEECAKCYFKLRKMVKIADGLPQELLHLYSLKDLGGNTSQRSSPGSSSSRRSSPQEVPGDADGSDVSVKEEEISVDDYDDYEVSDISLDDVSSTDDESDGALKELLGEENGESSVDDEDQWDDMSDEGDFSDEEGEISEEHEGDMTEEEHEGDMTEEEHEGEMSEEEEDGNLDEGEASSESEINVEDPDDSSLSSDESYP